jgi:phosphoglucosamine mutase
MAVRFGTDGVRGRAISELTPEAVLQLGRAAARAVGSPTMLVARDPRRSGTVLEAAFAAGCAAEGVNVHLLGIVPTPAVAWLAHTEGVAAAMITASHNPWTDNGIKVFAVGGRKLGDDQQRLIEAMCEEPPSPGRADSTPVGTISVRPDARDRYARALVEAVGEGSLSGLHVVVDAANGAVGPVAGQVFERLGARVEVHFDSQAGDDVNASCGATHPEALSTLVVAAGADLGVAFDGDGDRVIAVDHEGRTVDGDRLLALFATDRLERGLLPGSQVVVTVMSNLGFHRAMRAHGIEVVTTPVGDRHVLEAMERTGGVLGGEQSGHLIQRDLMPSGDGLLAAAMLAALVNRRERSLADLAGEVMTTMPQVLVNVAVAPGSSQRCAEALTDQVAAVEKRLGERGRVLVRASGTEPLVRIMVEAETQFEAQELADHLAGFVTDEATGQDDCTTR